MQKASIEAIKADADKAAKDGFKSYWLAEHPTGGFDALTVLAVIASSVPDIEMGTAVVPTFPRHPMALAGQALTSQTALHGATMSWDWSFSRDHDGAVGHRV